MSAHSNLNTALLVLTEKLQSLNDLVTANRFMIDALADQGDALKQMDGVQTKDMLRRQAREKFHPDTGTVPNAAALAILEGVLSHHQDSAEIIPFPSRT
ncbi:hypothetical protein [Leisingera methylohalidivorans]|uniref:Uncharacterized protein n=1 Tax=Leisingera methylohalidivorans DSM 14336 TaxID=999552 RepID=V9VVU0_9RHOB|nr:hypothetical protein [Leisingera methylohalidivorans]AHD01490.1 hypothetical protein METH_13080 [Leisingera methylohalidivorans DSM 14336]